jgi:hypothetical protein
MLQHIIPVNTTRLVQDPKAVAEAVIVIAFNALFGLIRMIVILRGDAVPMADTPSPSNSNSSKPLLPNLFNLAVRAYFDPPRIVFGKKGRLINVNIGPTSIVVLDATSFDSKVRIGMGGTSGTKFVFARCSEDDEEAKEFLPLLQRKPVSKRKVAMILLSIAGTATFGALKRGFQVTYPLAAVASLLSLGMMILIAAEVLNGEKIHTNHRKVDDSRCPAPKCDTKLLHEGFPKNAIVESPLLS